MEEHVFILDYLPRGRPDDPRSKSPVAYGIGDSRFVLLEVVPRPDANLLVGDRVYIGKDMDQRDKIEQVKGRIRHDQMTHAAQNELRFIIEELVKQQEERFVKFFNEAGPITMRMHALELLPGLGKKLMWSVLNERKKAPFQSFAEMGERIKTLHQPAKLIAHRIEEEITDPTIKYHLFVLPFVEREGPPHRG